MSHFRQWSGRFGGVGLLFLLLGSCSGATECPCLIEATTYVLPMHVGDSWEYAYVESGSTGSDGTRPDTLRQYVRITGMEEHDGLTWFVVESAVPGLNVQSRELIRSGNNLRLAYRTDEGRIDTIADLGTGKPDSTAPEKEYIRQLYVKADLNGSTFPDCIIVGSGYVDSEV